VIISAVVNTVMLHTCFDVFIYDRILFLFLFLFLFYFICMICTVSVRW